MYKIPKKSTPNKNIDYFNSANLNSSKILQKCEKLLSRFNFANSFQYFCEIDLRVISNSLYILIKFPLSRYRLKAQSFYFHENDIFPISDALISGEILHNGDENFQGKTIIYPEFELDQDKVSFSANPGEKLSLLVRICDETFTTVGSTAITDRRGNKDILGMIQKVKFSKVFIEIPETLDDYFMMFRPPVSNFTFTKLPEINDCPKTQACYNFLVNQNFDLRLFDKTGSRCYCSQCFSVNWINYQEIAGELYIIPRGWTRFGLKTSILLDQQNKIWDSWCNVFHGTNSTSAKSIIEHGTLLINKDIKLDGQRIGKNCSSQEWNNYYVSPHICYASHPWYSRVTPIEDRNGKPRYAQVVLACKIRYASYSKQAETEGGGKKIFDDYSIINENEIEWFSCRRGCIVPYGVMVRLFGKKKLQEINRLSYTDSFN